MKADININVGELFELLERLDEELQKKIYISSLRKGARVIVESQKRLAPYDPNRTKGIHLRDGIRFKKMRRTNKGSLGFTIGTLTREVPHAHLIEYGTVKQRARPFFLPGYLTARRAAEVEIINSLSKGVRNTSRRLAKRKRGQKKRGR